RAAHDLGPGGRRAAVGSAAAGARLPAVAAERARPDPGPAVHRPGAGVHVLPAARTCAGRGHMARRRSSHRPGGDPLMVDVLEVRGLNKSFGGIVVARNVDLTLQSGRVVGLIGPNGAGKTSLFNLITGVVKPESGTIALDGAPLDRLKFHHPIHRGLSRTWQNVRLFPSLPVLDNLLIATHQYPGERIVNILFSRGRLKEHDRVAREKASDILARMGLASVADALVTDLPYGQQKL